MLGLILQSPRGSRTIDSDGIPPPVLSDQLRLHSDPDRNGMGCRAPAELRPRSFDVPIDDCLADFPVGRNLVHR